MAKKARKTRTVVAPEVLLLLACDAASRDPNAGKLSLYGLFDTISIDEFPGICQPFSVIAKLTGKGSTPITLSMKPPRGKAQELGEVTIGFKNNQSAEIHFSIAGLEAKHPGKYKFLLEARGCPVGQPLTILVKRRVQQK